MTVNLTTMRQGGAYEGIQREKLPVFDSGSTSGNQTLTMDHLMRELYLINDSSSDNLALVITGPAALSLSFTLYPGEYMNERFPEFSTVTVTATGNWRWYVRSGKVT